LLSHEETFLQPQYFTMCDSKGTCTSQYQYSIPIEENVCDKWEFPEGRKKE